MRFSELVYNAVKHIPRGQVSTYKIIAKKINSRAYRAVGQSLKNNPDSKLIPCHRVVKSNGDIGGYFGKTDEMSIKAKIELLRNEGVEIKNKKVVNLEKFLYR